MTRSDDSLIQARRRNAVALFQTWAETALGGGAPPKGLEQAFAASIDISPSLWSQIKSTRPIGDKLARQIEWHCGKPEGWLDEDRPQEGLSSAEQQFIGLALATWRTIRPDARRALRAQLKSMIATR